MTLGTVPSPLKKRNLNARLHHSFLKHASRTAIDAGDLEITYRQLEGWIQAITNLALKKLPGSDARVVVVADHPKDYVAAMLALFQLGALYVPLNPNAPGQQTRQILKEVDPDLVLYGAGLRLGDAWKDYPGSSLPGLPDARETVDSIANNTNSEAPAYLFYTSGSTGKPKGIVGKLSSLDHFVEWETQTFALDHTSRISQFTTPTFDAFLRDALVPLSVGGTLCIPPERPTTMGSDRLWDWLEEKEVSLVHCVPSLFSTLLEGDWKSRSLPQLKQVLLAGEALPLMHAADWLNHWGTEKELVNLYGSTETTMVKLFHRIQPVDIENGFIPVGRAMSETEVFVLDERGKRCKAGEAGEIHVATEHRTLGYFRQPEATANVFKKTRYSPIPAYATGDLGTLLPSGEIQLLGRMDRQLKIGGVRIEPEAIERALLTLPSIQACAVRMVESKHPAGNLIAKEAVQSTEPATDHHQRLTAYLVLNTEITDRDLRSELEALLPAPAIPGTFLSVAALPRNNNGKIDYQALPGLTSAVPIRDHSFCKVSTATETRMRDIWETVLSEPHIGRFDNFFSLGGDSLKAMQVLNRLRRQFNTNCRATDLLKRPVLKDFCSFLDSEHPDHPGPEPDPWPTIDSSESTDYPLTPAQKGLWFLWKMDPQSAYYTCQGIIHLRGRYDPDALRKAWAALLDRHEILRVRFDNVSGKPVQRFLDEAVDWEIPEDLSYLNERDAVQSIRNYAKQDAATPFNLERDPLIRSRLFYLADDHHALQLTMHEITVDLWAIRILMNDLTELYQEALNGSTARLDRQAPSFRQYLLWQDRNPSWNQSQETHWKTELSGELPVLDLPLDRPRNASPSFRGKTVHKLLSPELTTALRQLSQAQGNTLYVTLLAGFFWILKRYTGQSDIIVGSPLAQRDRSENEHLMGFFLNMLPLRQTLDSRHKLAELLAATRDKVNGALEASDYPFTQILEWAKSARDTSVSPVFQVMFNMLSYSDPALEREAFSLDYESLETGYTKYDLSLYAQEYGDRLFLQIAYQTELFDDSTIQRFLDNLETFYSSMPLSLHQPLHTIPSIHPSEKQWLMAAAKGPEKSFDSSKPLIQYFEDRIKAHPEATAVIHRNQVFTYRQLNASATRLAARLHSDTSHSQTPIGLHLPRSFHMVAAVIACLKSRRPFVFLDPQYPENRLETIAREVGLTHLVCDHVHALKNVDCARMVWSSETEKDYPEPHKLFPETSDFHTLFSIVFTSASTGKPKGVRITQQALLNRFHWMWDAYPFSGDDVMLLQKSLGLVASSWECLGGLLQGAPTVVADHDDLVDPVAFTRLCDQHEVTRIHGSPALLMGVLDQKDKHPDTYRSLRLAFTSAEPISTAQAHQWNQRFPAVPLFNLYGSTECSSNAMEYACKDLPPDSLRVPLGRPLPNISTYVLDEHLNPVPHGAVGELCIGGACLAEGYHQLANETQKRFVSPPASDFLEPVLYRTGDLVRWRSDHQLEYFGRNDFQIKIRGFRIEPEEIENALNGLAEVEKAIVKIESSSDAPPVLVAYVTGPPVLDDRALRRRLRERLPDYMIPGHFERIDAFPRTVSGKIDRAELKPLSGLTSDRSYPNDNLDQSLEDFLKERWKDILNRPEVDLRDNFFELGGHSMLATQLFAAIEEKTGKALPVSTLYRAPTILELVQAVQDEAVTVSGRTIVPIRAEGSKPPLFCATPWNGSALYFRYLPRYLDENQPIFGLENEKTEADQARPKTLEELIQQYLGDLQSFYPTGPLHLCGFSGGGVVAWELARRLTEQGREVRKLILFDTSHPRSNPEQAFATSGTRARAKLRAHWNSIVRQNGIQKLVYPLESLWIKLQWHFSLRNEEQKEAVRIEQEVMQVRREHFKHYTASSYDGDILLLTARQRRLETILDPSLGWKYFTTEELEVVEVPGTHNTLLLEPNVKALCSELQPRLDQT